MTWEDRVRYLLRAALRAEGEGDGKVAETLRRMARDARPVEQGSNTPFPVLPMGVLTGR